jgi:hypothetical protein
LEFILPELLLLGFVEEGEISNMVYEYVAEQGQFWVFWRNFAGIRAEGCAEAFEGCGRGKLWDFVFGLLGDEFALEVCAAISLYWVFMKDAVPHNALAFPSR